jgi:hypothetical protein
MKLGPAARSHPSLVVQCLQLHHEQVVHGDEAFDALSEGLIFGAKTKGLLMVDPLSVNLAMYYIRKANSVSQTFYITF